MTNTIEIYVDRSCKMAVVKFNGTWVMEGNFWDFHPGCHGINEYGDFNGYRGLADAIKSKYPDSIITESVYTYE